MFDAKQLLAFVCGAGLVFWLGHTTTLFQRDADDAFRLDGGKRVVSLGAGAATCGPCAVAQVRHVHATHAMHGRTDRGSRPR